MQLTRTWDVVVVGGGFAGLSAATALADAGVRVLVVEARPRLGGRATAYRDPRTGERIDNGQHLLAGCYRETLTFLHRIGTGGRLRRPSSLQVAMVDEHGTRHELRLPPLASPLHLLGGVLAWRELTWGERLAILRLGPVLRRLANGSTSDVRDETVRQWLERHHQPARLRRLFWEPLALATLNQSIDRATAQPFLAVMARMLGGGAEAASLLVPATLLDALYAEPSRAFLEARGGACLTGKAARVVFDHDAVSGVHVGNTRYDSKVVVVAVTWSALRAAIEPAPDALRPIVERAAALASSPIVTANLWLDRAVMHDDFLGLPGRTFQWVFDKSRIVGQSMTHLSAVSSGAESIVALDTERLCRLVLDELGAALPSVRAATVRRISVVRERHATFALDRGMPARPGTTTPVDGLLLAGDWIDTGLPATIESAVEAGHRAALQARQQLKSAPGAPSPDCRSS